MKALSSPLSLLLLTSACAPGAVSSLGIPSTDGAAAFNYNQWLATSFSAPAEAAAVRVDSLTVRLDCAAPNQYIFIAITGTVAGRPAMDDIRIVADTAPLTAQLTLHSVVTFTLQPRLDAGPPVLLPGETYWIIAGMTSPDWDQDLPAGLFHWSYANTSAGTQSQDGWTVGAATATGNTAGQNWSVENGTPYSFSLALTTIPEPGVPLLAGLALLALPRRRSLPCA